MSYEMPVLPYATNALEPVISEATINLHYGKHLQAYVNNLNNLIKGTPYEGMTIEKVVKEAPDGPLFNNAGQVLNHDLYFKQFAAKPATSEPTGELATLINAAWGSFEAFKTEFNAASVSLFGSGWAWLALNESGKLEIVKESNAGNPLRKKMKPLLGFDVWEHSYYVDYQNRRADHINALWSIVNWDVVAKRL